MDLYSQYQSVRKNSIDLCDSLEVEDYIPQPIDFVSPPKWNLGHTTWFFEELILKQFVPFYKVYHAKYSYLFNSYYETVGKRVLRGKRGELSRPTVKEVYAYRAYVDEHIEEFINRSKPSQEAKELIILGLNHEQQHQELFLSDLKYTFSLNPLYPAYSERALCEEGGEPDKSFLEYEGGLIEIGYEGRGFAYDNELPKHRVFIQPYRIGKSLVSNEEFLEFIEAGGYEKHEYWHEEAWNALKTRVYKNPMYWIKEGNDWYQYTLAGLRKIISKHPATHISYFEAAAFARWKSMRLPTEFEWELASSEIQWGDRWEWTESAYLPYPGYRNTAGAIGEYNGKFMVNQKVLRGSSVATPKGHIERNTYRNFFHPHIGYQFNGIRLAK